MKAKYHTFVDECGASKDQAADASNALREVRDEKVSNKTKAKALAEANEILGAACVKLEDGQFSLTGTKAKKPGKGEKKAPEAKAEKKAKKAEAAEA